jgi:hypothetical protein
MDACDRGYRLPCVVGGRVVSWAGVRGSCKRFVRFCVWAALQLPEPLTRASGAASNVVVDSGKAYRQEQRRMATTEERDKDCYKRLAVIFLLWKAVLLTFAAFCPGPGYDTSALILLDPSVARHESFSDLTRRQRLTLNLFRWDALYLVKAAERGKVHEQEWAFSWAYAWLLSFAGRCESSQYTCFRASTLTPMQTASKMPSPRCSTTSLLALSSLMSATCSRYSSSTAF